MIQTLDRTQAPPLKLISEIRMKEVVVSKLDNGINLYSINAGFQDIVRIELIFKNATFDSKNPLIFSATNRMLSEGTAHHAAIEIADAIDYYGAYIETEENPDYVSVNMLTLNKHLESTLPYLREIIMEPVFPEAELNLYRRNHKQRLTVDIEKVGSIARRKLNETLFGSSHPYGYAVNPEDFDQLERTRLMEYHKKQYNSSACTMIASGLISDKTISLINRFLGTKDWNRFENKPSVYPEVKSASSRKNYFPKEGAVQSAVRVGKILINRSHPDFPGMLVVNSILGGNFSSRLMSNIREEKGYTYGIGSTLVSLQSAGYFVISTEVRAEVTNETISEIYKEIEILRNEPVPREELEINRNYLLGNIQKSFDGAFQLADRFKTVHLQGLTYEYYKRYLEKVRNIQADEIQALANKYLDTSSFFEVISGSVTSST